MNKIQNCIIFGILISTNCTKLTEEENIERLKKCGAHQLPRPSVWPEYQKGWNVSLTDEDWIVFLKNKFTVRSQPRTIGSFISDRHVVASSQVVMPVDWGLRGSYAANCKGSGSKYHEVDDLAVLADLEVVYRNKTLKVTKAALLWMCPTEPAHYKEMGVPMILELSEPVDVKFPCLPDENQEINGTKAFSYGLETYQKDGVDFAGELIKFREVTKTKLGNVQSFNYERWILVPKYTVAYDRGGPLVIDSDNRVTIIGIGANPGGGASSDTYFYSLKFHVFATNMCDFAGICRVDLSKITTAVATTVTSVTTNTVTKKKKTPITLATLPVTVAKRQKTTRSPERKKNKMTKEEQQTFHDLDYLDDLFVSAEFMKEAVGKMSWISWILGVLMCIFRL